MSEWQPIETAPTETHVMCGKWENGYNQERTPEWKTSIGPAWRSGFFGLTRKRTYFGEEYSHWKPLPEPPK